MGADLTRLAALVALAAAVLVGGAGTAGALPGPVARWPANGDAHDVAGGHDGTLENGATFGPGALGQAFSLDGIDDFVEVPDSPAWDFGAGDFTISLWANFASVDPSTIEQPAAIFIGHDEGRTSQSKWFFALGGGKLNFHVNSPTLGPKFLAQASFSPELERWYHLAVTRTAGTYRIYVDGAEVSSEADTNDVPDATAPLTIGQAESAPGAPEQFFMHGSLDEIEIFDRALSADELQGQAARADLSLNKTDAPDPVTAGQDLTYTLTVHNAGPDAARAVTVADTLPSAVTLVSADTTAGSCSGTTCDLGTLAKDATETVTIVVQPQAAGNVENSASVSSVSSDPDTSNNEDIATTTVVAASTPPKHADLRVALDDSPDPVNVGGDLTYTATVTNDGPDEAEEVTLADALPAGVLLLSGGPYTGSTTLSCPLGSLGAGASATVTIVVRPTAAGPLSNTVTASSETGDPDPDDNSATAATTVNAQPSADLAISGDAEPNPVLVGEQLVYTLTVRSNGPGDARGVEVTDDLPATVDLVSATTTEGSCGSGPQIICAVDELAGGAKAVITITVRPNSTQTLVNRASVVGTNSSNQHVELTTYVGNQPRGRVTIRSGDSPYQVRPELDYDSDPGVANRLIVTQEGNNYVLSDPAVTISAPRTCTIRSAHSASCYSSFWETVPLQVAQIRLGDGSDTAAVDIGAQVWPTGPTSRPQVLVDGGTGDDALETSRGGRLFGNEGADFLIAEGSVGAELEGAGGADRMLGGAGPDLITAGDGDFVNAEEGDDHVLSAHGYPDAPGRATFYGGPGFDTIDFSTRPDPLVLRLGRDSVVTGADGSSDFVAADFEGVIGGTAQDTLIGAPGRASYLDGGPTSSSERFGGPGDRLVGLDGDDTLIGSPQDDELYGAPGNDRLEGRDGEDKLYGGTGDDVLQGGHLDDRMEGGPGNDTVDYSDYPYGHGTAPFGLPPWSPYGPFEGVRVALAASGHHDGGFYDGGPACPLGTCYEYEGVHDLIAQVENVRGTAFADTLRGTDGSNVLEGLGGVDVIKAGGGNDRIDPGGGSDSVDAGGGDDLIDSFDGILDHVLGGAGLDRVWADPFDDLTGVEVRSDQSVLHPGR